MKKLDNLLLISLDGMSDADIAILRNMPNFQRLFMLVNNVDSVFLTNTYPVHTSVITEVLS
ncbi:MAG: alkaline phosphatase family protein [Fusobacteria bacterium]|nr:alkaline phosphatase family protein [Fusobacteriota bacterium]